MSSFFCFAKNKLIHLLFTIIFTISYYECLWRLRKISLRNAALTVEWSKNVKNLFFNISKEVSYTDLFKPGSKIKSKVKDIKLTKLHLETLVDILSSVKRIRTLLKRSPKTKPFTCYQAKCQVKNDLHSS